MSDFSFIDNVSEVKKNESLTAFFSLKGTEEFLQDHFEGFPVMPGVLLLESLKQASARLAAASEGGDVCYRLVRADEVKFGQFVRPGSHLKIFVRQLAKEGQCFHMEGRIDLIDPLGDGSSRKALTANIALEPAG